MEPASNRCASHHPVHLQYTHPSKPPTLFVFLKKDHKEREDLSVELLEEEEE
jgi:hypothetical protein